jgi:hypothetical protein
MKWRAEVAEMKRHILSDWEFCQEFVAKIYLDFHTITGISLN